MAIFSEILENKTTESIVYRGKKIDVTFMPDKLKQSEWESVGEADLTEQERSERIIELLSKVIDSWTLEKKKGENDFPPTVENLSREDFPSPLLLALFDRLLYLRQTAAGKLKVVKI